MTQQEFEHIAQQLRPKLLNIGRQFFNDEDCAEDIAQETLMRLWLLRERIEQQIGIVPLAIRMAKNITISSSTTDTCRATPVSHATRTGDGHC